MEPDRDEALRDKLAYWRSRGAPGIVRPRSHTTPVLHDDTGQQVGTRTEHWDDRVDATAKKFEVHVNPNLVARSQEASHGTVQ